jgi:hypothetical protein
MNKNPVIENLHPVRYKTPHFFLPGFLFGFQKSENSGRFAFSNPYSANLNPVSLQLVRTGTP